MAVAVAMVMTALVISTTERGLPPLAPYTPCSNSAPSERLWPDAVGSDA